VAAHEDSVYNLAYRVLGDEAAATEATQAAFVSALRELDAYRDGPFKVWVLRWLVRACLPRLGRRTHAAGAVNAVLPGCLAALPPAQRLALALVDIARLDYDQAASVLGLAPRQVRCELAAARQAICAATK